MNTETTYLNGTTYAVDDDPLFLDALSVTLENAGLAVRTFSSGREFLNNYRTDGAGCLVLDVSLPDLSGLEVQQELAARNVQLPIVFITGHGDVSTSVAALKNGAFHFLEKPVDHEALLSSVGAARRFSRPAR